MVDYLNKKTNIITLTGVYPNKNDYSGIFIKNEIDRLKKRNYNIKIIHETGQLKHLKTFYKAYKEMSKKDYSIIHAHYIFPYGTIGAILSKIFKKPLIITAHGSDVNILLKKKILIPIMKWTFKKCYKLICVSYHLKNDIKKIDNTIRLTVNPCSVDTGIFKNIPRKKCSKILKLNPKNKYLLYVGNLTKNKRVNLIIKSIPKVLSKYPNTHLIILGKGEKEEELIDLTNRYKINNNVHFIKNVSNKLIPYYINLSEIVLLVSKKEGTPVIATETCQCNKKIIITQPGELKKWKKYLPNLIIINEHDVKILNDIIIKEINKRVTKNTNDEFKHYFSLKCSVDRLVSTYNEALVQ